MSKTFISRLKKELELNGMFESQAQAVIELMIEGEKDSSMNNRWNESPDNYPEGLFNSVWELCKTYALKYTEENCPHAWFRVCFFPTHEQQAFLKQNNISV